MPIKLIVADDDAMFRKTIKELLGSHPEIKVVGEAEDGQQVIDKTAGLSPDIVLMDISMPKMSGLEATSYIKKHYPSIGVVIVTVHESEEYQIRAKEAGANNYLIKKDISFEPLVRMIQSAYFEQS